MALHDQLLGELVPNPRGCMSARSPDSQALYEAMETELMPPLSPLGFARAPPRHKPQPGFIVHCAERPLASGRTLIATVWNGGQFGLEIMWVADGIEFRDQVKLLQPWVAPGFRERAPLQVWGTDVLQSLTFMAGGIAYNVEAISASVPELAPMLKELSVGPLWVRARERTEAMWKTRLIRGDVDETKEAATVVFVGAKLVTVQADGVRQSFSFDASAFDREKPVFMSGWFTTPAGTRRALRLHCGERTWTFDPSGVLTTS
jgi:hypothetical protein